MMQRDAPAFDLSVARDPRAGPERRTHARRPEVVSAAPRAG
ncbi:hypothetical protein TVNIR_3457 [Thioalkalivibrio nitratireducens DSM 14787]|uniref:Uncharacterized protein n=1 Tax=Thioalkalivibrio nitratireducens (strain DSM 14787 / UNIQEM 213 / ALEN2) TaxID=1255043 RepID=L0E1B4_THIND|nr:hypothetical protein TVNIR_3457 [Thioalkalivibrio nitratireducens DSM 14787]